MSHPYTQFEKTAIWEAVDAALAELEQNRDVQVTTAREYVVGYVCSQLARQQLVTEASLLTE